MKSVKKAGSFHKATKTFNTLTQKTVGKLSRFNILNDTSKFHFDKFMWFCGLRFNSLRDYLPPPKDELEAEKEEEKRRNRKKKLILWCIFIAGFIFVPEFLRWALCWVWNNEEGVQYLQNLSVTTLGGSQYYHLPQLTMWSLHTMVIIGQWWYTQYADHSLLKEVVKPFIAIHHPKEAREMG